MALQGGYCVQVSSTKTATGLECLYIGGAQLFLFVALLQSNPSRTGHVEATRDSGAGTDGCARGGDTSSSPSEQLWQHPAALAAPVMWGLRRTELHEDRRPPGIGGGGVCLSLFMLDPQVAGLDSVGCQAGGLRTFDGSSWA